MYASPPHENSFAGHSSYQLHHNTYSPTYTHAPARASALRTWPIRVCVHVDEDGKMELCAELQAAKLLGLDVGKEEGGSRRSHVRLFACLLACLLTWSILAQLVERVTCELNATTTSIGTVWMQTPSTSLLQPCHCAVMPKRTASQFIFHRTVCPVRLSPSRQTSITSPAKIT